MSSGTVTITDIRCPREGEQPYPHNDRTTNVYLRQRVDGSLFCPVHGDITFDESEER